MIEGATVSGGCLCTLASCGGKFDDFNDAALSVEVFDALHPISFQDPFRGEGNEK